MKTIIKAVNSFNNKNNPYYHAVLDGINSHAGWYCIGIGDVHGYFEWYHFSSVKEFNMWAKEVVLE